MKKKGFEQVQMHDSDGTPMHPAKEDGNLATLASIIDALSSIDTDKLNTNTKSAEIMMPSDIQAIYKAVFDGSTSPLAAGADYTGSAIDVSNYTKIVGLVFADQDGDFYIDWSIDETNWDYSDHIAVTASTGAPVNIDVKAQYARVRYVNGATNQTVFRMQLWESVL